MRHIILKILFLSMVVVSGIGAEEKRPFTADVHKAKGIQCKGCHPAAPKGGFVPSEKCLACHGPATELANKTKSAKLANPHASPHWGSNIECTVCHRQHEKTVDWCGHCHKFDFRVP